MKKEVKDEVKSDEPQAHMQEQAPNVIDKVKSDGQRLYEIYEKSTCNVATRDSWDDADDLHVEWELFAKALLETGAKF
jgi:hypothetical protein